jgi:hypothetical protein
MMCDVVCLCLYRQTSPGPSNLNLVIATAQAVTSANRPVPPSKQSRAGTIQKNVDVKERIDPASVNAVVHLLEKGTPTSKKWQCRHCSYIQSSTESMHEDARCEFCVLPLVSLAPANATVSPIILRHALSTRDNVSHVLQPAPALTPSSSSSASAVPAASGTSGESSIVLSPLVRSRQRPYPRPDVWPSNKRCSICESVGVDKYCSCCKLPWQHVYPLYTRCICMFAVTFALLVMFVMIC